MPTPERLDPLSFVGAFAYEQTDIPPGMTLAQWRRHRATEAREAEAARRSARRRALRVVLTGAPLRTVLAQRAPRRPGEAAR